jgi:hypothetical protein
MRAGGASEYLGRDHLRCFAASLADQTTARPYTAEAWRGTLRTWACQALRDAFCAYIQTLHAGRIEMSSHVGFQARQTVRRGGCSVSNGHLPLSLRDDPFGHGQERVARVRADDQAMKRKPSCFRKGPASPFGART